MIRSRFNPKHQRPKRRRVRRLRTASLLRRLPLASAISAILAGGAPMAYAATARRRLHGHARGGHRDCAESHREPAERAGQHRGPRHAEARTAQYREPRRLRRVPRRASPLSRASGRAATASARPTCTCAASTAARTATIPARNRRVGTYFDEQPVTTIDGTVDMHVYDIARIEVLEGPQGTLYGASSEAGTIRIITNKPDPTKFEASYDVSGDAGHQRRRHGLESGRLRQYPTLADHGGAHRRLGRARPGLHQQCRGNQRSMPAS